MLLIMTTNQAASLLTIDLGALAANYRILQKAARAPVAGVVKANGYGLGLDKVGPTLATQGCSEFFVANIDEGITLRKAAGNQVVIYVIGPVLSGNENVLRQHNLVPVLNCLADVEHWRQYGNDLACAIHFDTGMNRLGLEENETARVLDNPQLIAGINLVLGMSHFASSEELNDPLNDLQIKRFRNITSRLPLKRWSLCNTSAIFQFSDDHYNLVRGGYGLYGGNPLLHTKNPMQPVASLSVRILHTKCVKRGESIGYNATYTPDCDDEVAVVAMGYADGFLRSLSSKGSLYWQGQPCLITGRVSMDLTTIRIGHLKGKKPQIGDMLEVLGPSQHVDALAKDAGTNGYEILTRLGMRYNRVYIDAP